MPETKRPLCFSSSTLEVNTSTSLKSTSSSLTDISSTNQSFPVTECELKSQNVELSKSQLNSCIVSEGCKPVDLKDSSVENIPSESSQEADVLTVDHLNNVEEEEEFYDASQTGEDSG